jgi:hypothetical protein
MAKVGSLVAADFWVWLVPAKLPPEVKLPAFIVAPFYAVTLAASGFSFQPAFVLAFVFSWIAGIWSLSGAVRHLREAFLHVEMAHLLTSIRNMATFGRGDMQVAEAELWAAAAKRDRDAFDAALLKYSETAWRITASNQPSHN